MGKRYKEKNNNRIVMNTKKKNRIIVTLIIASIFFVLLLSSMNGLFSDKISNVASVYTGDLSVKVENLKVYEESSDFVLPDESGETNIKIGIDEVCKFSFDVKNTGTSGISTDVYLNINFDASLNEKGIILLFPVNISDENIIDSLKNGNDDLAIIKLNANDQTSIDSSEGTFNGIRQKLETRLIDSDLPGGTTGIATTPGETEHNYEYKIVFFSGDDINNSYYNRKIEVSIDVEAKLYNLTDGNWISDDSDYFKIKTRSDIGYISDGLILLYDGKNNTGEGNDPNSTIWKDLIGNNDGKLVGNPTWGTSGLKFDGMDDKVEFKGDIPGIYTIIATFYNDPLSTTNFQRICSESPFPSICIDTGSPKTIRLFGHGEDQKFASAGITGAVQVVMCYDGEYVSLYINGEYASKIQTSVAPASIAKAYLGGRAANDRQFKGEIYNFMIYDRVLTVNEIKENYSIEINRSVIPIKTLSQLMKIGSNDLIKIDGKYYEFLPDATYEVKNNISFSNAGIWTPNISGAGRINTYDKVITITNTNDNTIHYYQNQLYVTKDNAIKDGLVLHYDSINNTGSGHNNNASTWKDLKGNNDGTIVGGPIWSSNSLNFNANDEKITYRGDITNNYSMVITIKPEITGTHPRLFGENPFPTLYLHSNNQYKFAFYGQGKDAQFSPSVVPVASATSYIVVTFDGSTISLYVNGEKIGTLATTTLPSSVPTAYLGANGTTTRQYKGKIYDFMIYDKVLTDFEIERSYLTNKSKYID